MECSAFKTGSLTLLLWNAGLIHLELADLSMYKPYLSPDFDKLAVKGPAEETPAKKSAKDAGKDAKTKKKKKLQDSDDDDEETPPPSPVVSKSKKVKMQVRQPCKDCKPIDQILLTSLLHDTHISRTSGGQVHKEIFTFQRPTEGGYKGREWDGIVHPVIEKWGMFVQAYT